MRKVLAFTLMTSAALGADKYAADWMEYGAGARALAMGGAFVAVADDGTAPYWNAAGMASVPKAAASAMHSYAFDGLATYDAVFGAYNAGGWGAFGGGMLRFATDDIKWTEFEVPGDPTSRPKLIGYFNWADYAFYASYARRALRWLDVGLAGKFIYGSHFRDEWGSSGEGLDVAAQAGPFGPVKVGVKLENVLGRLEWGTGTVENLPFTAKAGGAYRRVVPDWASEFTLAVDVATKFSSYGEAAQFRAGAASFDLYGGGEWWYRRTVAFRLGADRGILAGGVGVAVKAAGAQFGVDYAYLADKGLEASHRASVSVLY